MLNSDFDLVIEKIKCGELEIDVFLDDVKKHGNIDELIKLVRLRLVDDMLENDRSIYCGIIREINDKGSLPLLWELLERDETVGRRGSLVFAMEKMNPINYLEQLVNLAINDNYEVMFNCLDIIDRLEGHVDGETISRCIVNLKIALKNDLPEWKKEPLKMLLDELDSD